MDKLRLQVRRVRRRLAWQRFLQALPWCLFGTLLAVAAIILVDKIRPLGVQAWVWPVAGLLAGAVSAGVWTWFSGPDDLDAAIQIDRRFGLSERVSSTLALGPEEMETPAGQALLRDAAGAVQRIDVSQRFGLSLSRWSLLPLAPALAAFVLAVVWHPAIGENAAVATTERQQEKQQVKTTSEVLRRKLAERQEEARKKGLKDAQELFTKLEQGTKQLVKNDDDRKQALVKLNDLAKDLEKRRQELGGSERIKEQLEQLKNLAQGPADKMADAMRHGEFQKAADELKKLRDQIENGQLDPQKKAELAKQLGEMEDKLRKLADAHRKAREDLKSQIAEKRAAGKNKEADDLEEKLAKLEKQAAQMQRLEKMAGQLGKCGQCLKQGDGKNAANALGDLEAELAQLAKSAEESQLLDEALDQLADAKGALGCKFCNGKGCKHCQGGGFGEGDGDGLGRGQGHGDRPEKKGETSSYDTHVKQKLSKGQAVVTDRVDGPNVKGRVEQEVRTEFDAVVGGSADPLTGQKLPREYRDHARTYFDTLREGEKPAEPSKP
jgi:hypothetical protein